MTAQHQEAMDRYFERVDTMKPIHIRQTSKQHYMSFQQALNLRAPGEDTGDWHFLTAFHSVDGQGVMPAAGPDGLIDTTPSLGDKGIRDMADILEQQNVRQNTGPVFVANHFRAIADIAMMDLVKARVPMRASNRTINQWLDTPEQIETLRADYLLPLRSQLHDAGKGAFDTWIATIQFD